MGKKIAVLVVLAACGSSGGKPKFDVTGTWNGHCGESLTCSLHIPDKPDEDVTFTWGGDVGTSNGYYFYGKLDHSSDHWTLTPTKVESFFPGMAPSEFCPVTPPKAITFHIEVRQDKNHYLLLEPFTAQHEMSDSRCHEPFDSPTLEFKNGIFTH
jgi:hypothetical protein